MKRLSRKLLREAWVAGVKAQRASLPWHGNWAEPETYDFYGSEFEKGMRAAARVLMAPKAGKEKA